MSIKLSQAENKKFCLKILKQYRTECEKELKRLLTEKGKDYELKHINEHDFMKLAKYKLKNDDNVLFIGSFEAMKDFIINEI